jgi:osmotically-inducible protein OsmY
MNRHGTSKRIMVVLALALLLAVPAVSRAMNRPTDAEITSWVKRALRDDPRVFAGDIHVATRSGVVKLSGRVWNLAESRYANLEAKKIRGVRAVIDEIQVAPMSRADDQIRRDIEQRLKADAVLASEDIQVAVKDGVATLTGTVDSYTKKQVAETDATEVLGLQRLDNKIHTEWRARRDDMEIEHDVRASLARDVYLVDQPIICKVDHGVVTLEGEVGTPYQKQRALELAWVDNVQRVVDDLRVEPWLDAGVRKLRPVLGDAELANAVHAAIMQDLRIEEPFEVSVTVHHGNATLTGVVPNYTDERIAAQDARNVVGIGWVANLLVVNPERLPDAQVATAVQSALDSDWAVGRQHLHVSADRGVVVLTGRVNTTFEKAHASDVAGRISGVRKVVNDLVVSARQHASDYVLVDRVKARLDADWVTSWLGPDIHVAAHDGVVTLSGVVATWAERIEASRVAAGTQGVLRVDNELAVRDLDYPWAAMQDEGPYVMADPAPYPGGLILFDLIP